MEEVIVRVLRAVACFTRLRLVERLMSCGELTPSQLARDLRVSRDLVSAHLARLSAAGLIRRRRSGARCFCRADSPYGEHTLSGAIAAWLRTALAADPANPVSAPAAARTQTAPPEAHRVVFQAATAFTSPRRLQILRRLARGGRVHGKALSNDLRMSATALSRHLDKLIRRGYVSVARAGRGLLYTLLPAGSTPHHARLLEIVKTHWEKRVSRS
ncbi:MAG: ArsR family transcriptional regulator [Planctomycetes bacterium]|nr:ArsR family transcriptional regulator [Planctomycetota bacterium]